MKYWQVRGHKKKEADIIKQISDTLGGNKIYDSNGDKVAIPDFKDMTVGVFGSYGITDDLTLMVNAAVFNNVQLDTTATAFGSDTEVKGFGDIFVGAKYKLAKFGQSVISGKFYLTCQQENQLQMVVCGQVVEIIIKH